MLNLISITLSQSEFATRTPVASQCFTMSAMHMMHRNNGAAFLNPSGIACCRAFLNMPSFSCLPRSRSLARSGCHHVSCASIYDRYQLYIYCTCMLMKPQAYRSSLLPSPTILLSFSQFLSSPLMSHTHPTSTSSNFQLIFDSALKEYKKRTKNDLLTHPLADKLEVCNSASRILTVLQEQVQELNQSQRRNEKWTRWLDPTVKVLHGFSVTLEEHVTLVCLSSWTCLRSALSYLFDRHFHRQRPSLPQSASCF